MAAEEERGEVTRHHKASLQLCLKLEASLAALSVTHRKQRVARQICKAGVLCVLVCDRLSTASLKWGCRQDEGLFVNGIK